MAPLQQWLTNLPLALNRHELYKTETFNRTFRLRDINSDGQLDLCYRLNDQYQCHYNTGRAFENQQSLSLSLDSTQWEQDFDYGFLLKQQEASIQLININADAYLDFCFISGNSILCSINNGHQFTDFGEYGLIVPDTNVSTQSKLIATNVIKQILGLRTTYYSTSVLTSISH